MLVTFRAVFVSLMRNPGLLVWAVGLPLALSNMFIFMFDSLERNDAMGELPVVVVRGEGAGGAAEDGFGGLAAGWSDAGSFAGSVDDEGAFLRFVEAVSADGDPDGDGLLSVTYASSAEEAQRLVADSQGGDDAFVGYIAFEGGQPRAYLYPTTETVADLAKQSIVVLLLDQYVSRASLVRGIVQSDPMLLADGRLIATMTDPFEATERISVTQNPLSEKVRYYFALLGFAALSCATMGLTAVLGLRGCSGPLGARRAVGGVSHSRALLGTLLASWAASFLCLLAVFLFMSLTVDFGDRVLGCLAVLLVASLTAVSLGCAVAVIPKLPDSTRAGIITAVTCMAALFTGLYGQPTMELADRIARAVPASTLVNPAAQIAEAFYGLLYYDSFAPTLGHLAILLAMCAVLFALSARALRRQRYASL